MDTGRHGQFTVSVARLNYACEFANNNNNDSNNVVVGNLLCVLRGLCKYSIIIYLANSPAEIMFALLLRRAAVNKVNNIIISISIINRSKE